jgi:type II secretory ATPase GspE/PulE/Tfp pilus assembly ATPase PilB-like protein
MWLPKTDIALASQPPLASDEAKGPINNLSDVPTGTPSIEHLPLAWRDRFAVLLDEAQRRASILAVPQAMGSAALFELRRRLHDSGLRDLQIRPATAEIVKLLHSRRDLAPASLLSADDATGIERFAHKLIEEAIRHKASDIHIETREDHALVFFRVNGLRQVFATISHESARSLGVVLYSVHADATSKEVSWDSQQVMDGVIEYRSDDGRHAQLRFSSAPIFPSGNFHIVIRVLLMDSSDRLLADLGYSEAQLTTLENISAGLSGMVIVCGPTNSGKSTTLQALMKSIHRRLGETVKMITVEDPVEYLIPGACQIGVARKRKTAIDERTGSAFTTFLRGTLRQDPDVVMVGEIRDIDSASVVKDLVLAGRKVLTTLHTYSAIWAFVRLRELGVPIELLTMPGFVSGILYQRLVPTLCNHCALPLASASGRARLDVATLQRLQRVVDFDEHPLRVRGDGCEHCQGTGIGGRTLCAELVVPDKQLLELIARERYLEAESYWQQRGHLMVDKLGVSALAHGVSKLRAGLLDPRDLENNIGPLDGLELPR